MLFIQHICSEFEELLSWRSGFPTCANDAVEIASHATDQLKIAICENVSKLFFAACPRQFEKKNGNDFFNTDGNDFSFVSEEAKILENYTVTVKF